MTERIYYTDPYVREFEAEVLRTVQHEGRQTVVLDRTAFYPTSGGQPSDRGTLGSAAVADVVDGEDGTVLHVLDGPAPGGRVRGTIDWDRRFDHMQQHTGQHVLSAAFHTLVDARTESFHLGAQSATIDLSREVSPAEIARAEREANRIVWEDRPVAIRFADADEAARLPLRKESDRTGVLRLIDVEGFDISACGGTHVARTGGIGIIAIGSWERFKGGSRIEFVCGLRALRAHAALRDIVAATIRLVSVMPEELPSAIERMQSEARESRRAVKDAQSKLAGFEAAALAAAAEAVGGTRVVVAALEGWDAAGLKSIASAVAQNDGHLCVLFSTPAPSAVVIARGPNVTTDCATLLKNLTAAFGGKGGGRADLAQGGGLQAAPDLLTERAWQLVRQ